MAIANNSIRMGIQRFIMITGDLIDPVGSGKQKLIPFLAPCLLS